MALIDLHCHTTASDGLFAPADLVKHAAERDVGTVAITDHDTVAGYAAAANEGEKLGVRVVPGIEVSTREGSREVHLLGYFLDTRSDALTRALSETREQRRERATRIVERLRDLGYGISMEDVEAQAQGDVIARPHVARALVGHGYVRSVREAFTADLIGDGGRAYVPRTAMSTTAAIELVGAAGGVSVLAHPGVSYHEGEERPLPEELVAGLAAAGIAGLEVDHPDHAPLVRDRLRALADELGLVVTGGSDWHGHPEHTLGGWTTSEESLERLEAMAAARAGG